MDVPLAAYRRTASGERGQVVPLLAVVMVFVALVGVGLVHLAGASARRGAAQAAADAAALAGALAGESAAGEAASANGASLVSFRTDGLDVVVVVHRRDVTATARARWQPSVPGWSDDEGG